jgi:O-antigen/teichoic acid export membrane protein
VYEIRAWLRSALPVSLVDATDVLFLNADILILGLFVEAELVAFYFAATRLAQMLGYVPYGVSAVSAQRFAALGASRDTDRLQSMIQTAALGSTVLSMGGAVFLTLRPAFCSRFSVQVSRRQHRSFRSSAPAWCSPACSAPGKTC